MTPLPFPQLLPLCQPAKLLYCQHPFSGASPKRQVCNKLRTLKTKRSDNRNKFRPQRSYNFISTYKYLPQVSEIYNSAKCLQKIAKVQHLFVFWCHVWFDSAFSCDTLPPVAILMVFHSISMYFHVLWFPYSMVHQFWIGWLAQLLPSSHSDFLGTGMHTFHCGCTHELGLCALNQAGSSENQITPKLFKGLRTLKLGKEGQAEILMHDRGDGRGSPCSAVVVMRMPSVATCHAFTTTTMVSNKANDKGRKCDINTTSQKFRLSSSHLKERS